MYFLTYKQKMLLLEVNLKNLYTKLLFVEFTNYMMLHTTKSLSRKRQNVPICKNFKM